MVKESVTFQLQLKLNMELRKYSMRNVLGIDD